MENLTSESVTFSTIREELSVVYKASYFKIYFHDATDLPEELKKITCELMVGDAYPFT